MQDSILQMPFGLLNHTDHHCLDIVLMPSGVVEHRTSKCAPIYMHGNNS